MVIGTTLLNFHGWYCLFALQKKPKKTKTTIGCTTWNKTVLTQSYQEVVPPKPMLILPDE
jgi:hypothetical protein